MNPLRHVKSTRVIGIGLGALVSGSTLLGAGIAHADPVQVTANGSVNVRSGPGTDTEVLGTFGKGQRVDTVGSEEGGWVPVRFMGGTGYIKADFVKHVGSDGTVTDAPEPSAPEPETPDQPQAPAPAPNQPSAENAAQQTEPGVAYTTTELNVRSAPSAASNRLTTLARGTEVSTTGRTQDGFTQINHGGGTAWVSSQYLSDSRPAPAAPAPRPVGDSKVTVTGEKGLQPNTRRVLEESKQRFPQIKVYGGVRPDPLPDHPSGRALDIMIPDYRANNALGWEIANYYRAHASEFGIDYIIFDQQIWSVARDGEGWRSMSDRGGDTANHRDHVHITVK